MAGVVRPDVDRKACSCGSCAAVCDRKERSKSKAGISPPIDRSCLRRAPDQATSCLEPRRALAMDRKHEFKQQLARGWGNLAPATIEDRRTAPAVFAFSDTYGEGRSGRGGGQAIAARPGALARRGRGSPPNTVRRGSAVRCRRDARWPMTPSFRSAARLTAVKRRSPRCGVIAGKRDPATCQQTNIDGRGSSSDHSLATKHTFLMPGAGSPPKLSGAHLISPTGGSIFTQASPAPK